MIIFVVFFFGEELGSVNDVRCIIFAGCEGQFFFWLACSFSKVNVRIWGLHFPVLMRDVIDDADMRKNFALFIYNFCR